jgi:hypothetical protein
MEYKYCHNKNFEDFAAGRVLLHRPGFPNFPVRLAQEIFLRCVGYSQNKTNLCVYDPCCGSGYMMTVIGLLNLNSVGTVVCSDCDDGALEAAGQNLKLLTVAGMRERINHLRNLYAQFNKTSHQQAIDGAVKLQASLTGAHNEGHTINAFAFKADILAADALKHRDFKADIVFTDVPHGNLTPWHGEGETGAGHRPDKPQTGAGHPPDNSQTGAGLMPDNLLVNLRPVLKPGSVVAICSDKKQRVHRGLTNPDGIRSLGYTRLEKHQIGKRKFEIFIAK